MKTLLCCALMLAGAVLTSAGDRMVFYVAPNGNDRWSGRLAEVAADGQDGPFATVQRAQLALREWRAASAPPATAPVRQVRSEGLTFAHAAWPIPRQGQAVPQAEINLDGALSATHAEEIVLKGCAVRHVGA